MDILGVVIASAIAAVAWLYQKAWERHDRRTAHYEAVMSTLAQTSAHRRDPAAINAMIDIYHRLWISAPDNVILAFRNFYNATNDANFGNLTADMHKDVLGKLVIEMRRDASFRNAIFPRFRTTLKAADFLFMSGVKS